MQNANITRGLGSVEPEPLATVEHDEERIQAGKCDERQQLQVWEKSARCRWPISDDERAKAIHVCTSISSDPKSTRRAKTAALRVLAQFDSITQRDMAHVERLQQERGFVEIRQQRADEGKVEAVIGVQVLPPPVVMPAPDWLNRMGLISPNRE